MIKTAVIGLGKMGLSHVAILGAHPDVDLVAVCDASSMILNAFRQYNKKIRTYDDAEKMFSAEKLDAVYVVTPTKYHYPIVRQAMENGINVFCEKPLTLSLEDGRAMVALAKKTGLVNQVGYHNHFIGTFREMKRLLEANAIGRLFHFQGEAYGPVVTKPKGGTWRAKPEEGGGCLNDYASHVLNLIQEIIGRPEKVRGTTLKKIYSKYVEDAVFSTLITGSGLSGQLSVNWSDETYRKMSTSLMAMGEGGKIICDATELKIYLKEENRKENLPKGWTIKYITDLAQPVDFYLRGEEYSAEDDYFVRNVVNHTQGTTNTFEQALYTDTIVEMLNADAN